MGYIPSELSADEARNLYSQGEISAKEIKSFETIFGSKIDAVVAGDK